MNFLELIREAGNTKASVKFLFERTLSQGNMDIVVSVEGDEDLLYIKPVLQSISQQLNTQIFVAKGKPNVLELYANADDYESRFEVSLGFVIDADYDVFLDINHPQDDRLLITSGYSIENTMVSIETFTEILRDTLKLEPGTQLFDSLVQSFDDFIEKFSDWFKDAAAYLISAKVTDNLDPSFRMKTKSLLSFENGFEPVFRDNSSALIAPYLTCDVAELDDLLASTKEKLSSCDPDSYVRGHCLMDAFCAFINAIVGHLRCNGLKGIPKHEFTPRRVFSECSSGRPIQLHDFIANLIAKTNKPAS